MTGASARQLLPSVHLQHPARDRGAIAPFHGGKTTHKLSTSRGSRLTVTEVLVCQHTLELLLVFTR